MKTNILFLILMAALSPLSVSRAALECFLKIDAIPGDSTDAKHPGEIVVNSFTNAVTMPLGAGGVPTGKPIFQDFTVTKFLDKTSPVLMLKCAQGVHFPTAVLTIRRPNGPDYYKITLSDFLISSVSSGGASTDDRPTEFFSMNFSAIAWEFTPQNPDGSLGTPIRGTWNLKTNAP